MRGKAKQRKKTRRNDNEEKYIKKEDQEGK